MRRCDIIARPYAYSWDVFYNCTKPRRVTAPTTTLVATSFILILSITLSTILLFVSLNCRQSFTCQRDPYVPNKSSLHLKQLLGYYLTPLSVLSVHFSIVGLVVLSIIFPSKQVPSFIIFQLSFLPFTGLITQMSPTSVITFLIYSFLFRLNRLLVYWLQIPYWLNIPYRLLVPTSSLPMLQFYYRLQNLLNC